MNIGRNGVWLMNEPIINPWLIYLAEVAHSIEGFCLIMFLISSLVVVAYCLEKEQFPTFSMCVIPMLCALIITAIPPRDAIYKIIIASNVTPDLLLKTGETAEAVATRALDLIADSVIKVIREVK